METYRVDVNINDIDLFKEVLNIIKDIIKDSNIDKDIRNKYLKRVRLLIDKFEREK